MTKAKTVGTSRAARFTVGNRRTGRMETVDFRGVTALRRERQRAAEEVDQHIQGALTPFSIPLPSHHAPQVSVGKPAA